MVISREVHGHEKEKKGEEEMKEIEKTKTD